MQLQADALDQFIQRHSFDICKNVKPGGKEDPVDLGKVFNDVV